MEPYSYFLPKPHKVDGCDIDKHDSVSIKSVFYHSFGEDALIKPIYLGDNGRTLTICSKNSYKSYHIDNSVLVSTKTRILLNEEYDHKLYDCKREIVFLFKSEIIDSDNKKCTHIYISYVIPNESDEWQIFETALVLEFNHVFNRYYCFLSHELQKIVILTGHHQYGFRKTHLALYDTHLNVITYNLKKSCRNIEFNGIIKRNVTDACRGLMGNYFNQVNFTVDESKLILASLKEQLLVVYSIESDKFGDVYRWSTSGYHSCHYAYNKQYGNLFLLCIKEGQVKILMEKNLNMISLEEKSFSIHELGYEADNYDYFHVDYYENIVIYVKGLHSDNLLMIDCLEKKVIGTYPLISRNNYKHVMAVTTNWSGEEVFLLMNRNGTYVLEVLYYNKKLTLKDASKLAVLQVYPVVTLKSMNLPKMLKCQFYQQLYQWW